MKRTVMFSLMIALCASSARAEEWKLVWSDEFDYTGLPDPDKWTYEEGFIRNAEMQFYRSQRKENTWVADGVLTIRAIKEHYPNPLHRAGAAAKDWKHARTDVEYTSASITTKGKAAWSRGRIEVKAKIPTGRGMWPAIWMLGLAPDHRGWPACGEIDILENVGYQPNVVHANAHTGKYNHRRGNNKGASLKVDQPFADFHVYAIEWTGEKIDFYFDDNKYFTYENEKSGVDAWPYDWPHYLILNIAVGGGWGGQKGIDDSIFPQTMLVDYVRVYQRAK